MIDYPSIKTCQDSLEEKLYFPSVQPVAKSTKSIVSLIKHLPAAELADLIDFFGPLGVRLQSFCSAVSDLSLPPKNDLLCEIIQIYQFVKNNNLNYFNEVFKEELIKSLNKDSDLKRIDSPFSNNQFIRFISDKEQRNTLRKTKSMHEVGLNTFYKKGNWESYPKNYKFYERFSNDYSQEIEKIKNKAEKYKEIGCHKLYSGIMETTKDLEELFYDNYLGFHRITMSTAAVIMARMHGFTCLKLVTSDLESHMISVPRTLLSGMLEDGPTSYVYKPKACPFTEVKSAIPENIERLVEHLENNPELQGGATFDHLIILMPSVEFFDGHNEMTDKFFDLMMIRNRSFIPVILGEKDGKCYFISYFI